MNGFSALSCRHPVVEPPFWSIFSKRGILISCPPEQNKIRLTAVISRGAANGLHQKEGSSSVMEGHRLDLAVSIAGMKMLLATVNPWVLGIGFVALSSVAVVGMVSGSYVACKALKVVRYWAGKAKDEEREADD